MSDTAVLLSRVNAVLADAIEVNATRWAALQSDLATIFQHIESLVLGGGKRLRPQFAHWGWVAAGGDPMSEQSPRLGAGIELLHVAALFHDDVIDDAATRRGTTATHRALAEQHHTQQWSGESRRHGEGSAILIGDFTYVLSDSLMDHLSPAARHIWHDLRMEMNIGQYLDVLGSSRRTRDVHEAELICRMKSAKYTVERPLHLGAVAADANRGQSLMPMMSAYGLAVGDAFQMRDDILGAFGDSEITGKPVGGDFHEGKPTPLLANACAMATSSDLAVLEKVGLPGLTNEDISQIQQAVINTGALAVIEQRIASLHDDAVQALDRSQLQGDAYDALVHLADVVTQRNL